MSWADWRSVQVMPAKAGIQIQPQRFRSRAAPMDPLSRG